MFLRQFPRFLLLLFLVSTTDLYSAVVSTFSEKGLSSIRVGEREILAGGTPTMSWVAGPDGKPISPKLSKSSFSSASKILSMEYNWGTIEYAYDQVAEGLRLKVKLTNTGELVLTNFRLTLMSLKPLGEGKASPAVYGVEEPAFTYFQGSEGTVVLGAEAPKFPLSLNFAVDPKSGNVNAVAGFGGDKVVVDGVQLTERLAPGESREFQVVLRFAPAGGDPMVMGADFLDAFRKANPAVLNWSDRRPIFRAFFGGGLPRDQALTNLKDPAAVKPPEVDAKFRENLLRKMDGIIEASRIANAQGVILWDLEGGTFPHATTYIGDPRLIRVLNPQMDLVADEAMRKLKEAGLRSGITLRPSRVIYDPVKNDARHSYADAGDAFSELDAKVAYAKGRWGTTIFYVDTNFFWRPYGPEKKWQSGPISADVWRKLHAKYPDTLFIPEFAGTADYASTAGYGEADMGNYGVPAMAKALYPDAFRVIVIEDADPAENFDRFVGALAAENSLMTFGQGQTNVNTLMVMRLQKQVELEQSSVPASVAAASPGELINLLADNEMAVRFHAARRLAETPDPAAAGRLLEMVQAAEEEWIVRRAALVALGKFPHAPAIPVLFGLLDDRTLGLYADAARALAGQDASVEELAVEKIRAASLGKGRSNVYDQTGAVLVLRKARDRAPALQEIFAQMPEGETQNRRALLTLIGELRNPESEAFLLPLLVRPEDAPAAAAALVRIGSVAGVQQVKAAAKTAKESGNKQLADALGRALQVR